jgi:ABC-type dipeptide/oligopeptide/nickel transport system permease component
MLAETGRALALIAHRDVEVWQIAGVSLAVSFAALVAALVLGLPLTYAVARSGSRATRIGLWTAHSFAALPTVVVGLTLYFVLSAGGPLGWTKLPTRTAMALGSSFRAAAARGGRARRAPPAAGFGERSARHARRDACPSHGLAAVGGATAVATARSSRSRAFTELGSP